jgi:hypothetical protein
MGRLSWTGWLGVVGVAVFLAIALLPNTSWVAHRHIDTLQGNQPTSYFPDSIDGRDYTPGQLALPTNPRDVGDALLRALVVKDDIARRRALEKVSDRYPDNAFVQATFGRQVAQIGVNWRREPFQPDPKYAEWARMLAEAGRRGEKADPNNAFFSLLATAGYLALQEDDRARATMTRMVDKSSFSDYAFQEGDLFARRLRQLNYGGNYAVAMAYCSILFPYYATEKNLVRWFISHGDERERTRSRLIVLRIADCQARKTNTLIGILVAAACANIAIRPQDVPSPESHAGTTYTDHDRLVWARRLQERASKLGIAVPGFDAEASMRMQATLVAATKKHTGSLDLDEPPSPEKGIVQSIAALLATLSVAIGATVFSLGGRLRTHAWAAFAFPTIPALIVDVCSFPEANCWAGLQAALILGACVAYWFPRARLGAWIGLFAVVAIAALTALMGLLGQSDRIVQPEQAAALLLVVSVAISRFATPVWLSWGLAAVEVIGLGVFYGLNATNDAHRGVLSWATASTAAGIGVFLLCTGTTAAIAVRRIVGPCVLAGSLVYAWSVGRELSVDQQYRRMVGDFQTEVQGVRDIAAHTTLGE